LYKAHKRGVVSAVRDDSGAIFIDAAELFRVVPERGGSVPGKVPGNDPGADMARTEDMERMIRMLESERDFLRNQLSAMTEQLAQAHEERRAQALLTGTPERARTSAPTEESPCRLVHKLFGRGAVMI
jgi:hypothetical protein